MAEFSWNKPIKHSVKLYDAYVIKWLFSQDVQV